MPQEHHVLRCFSCETFQVHIVKKSKKWECKICGAKQSVKRNYGKGSGKDCRNQVMKLNELRVLHGNSSKLMKNDQTLEETFIEKFKDQKLGREKSSKSKWTEYLDEVTASERSESENATDSLSEKDSTKKRIVKELPESSQNSTKKICRNYKSSGEFFSKICDEINPSFPMLDETFENSDKKNLCETKPQKNNYEKFPKEMSNALNHSKYAQYMDNNEDEKDATQINKSSIIFNSYLDDLDNILNI